MSVEHLAVALHHSRATGTTKLVLLGIANHAGDGGAWPAIATLARYANVRPRQVKRALAELVELGEVERHVQQGGLAGWDDYTRPNRYDVLLSCPEWCDRTPAHRLLDGWAWSEELREVVRVEQLHHLLSTGDTPGCTEPGDTPQTPGVLQDTGCPTGHPGGVVQDTQTIPEPSPPVHQSVRNHQHAREETAPPVVHSHDQLRRQLADASAAHRARERRAGGAS